MRIIKNNYRPTISNNIDDRLGTKRCPYCNSEVEVESEDIKIGQGIPIPGPSYEPPYEYWKCPCCSRDVVVRELYDSI